MSSAEPANRTLRPAVHRELRFRLLAVVTFVFAIAVLGAGPASAHAKWEETTPANGRTLDSPPRTVSLRFNEPMINLGVTVRVTGPKGAATKGKATIKGRIVTQALADSLPAGAYKVQWRVASEDGHPISGTSAFTVTAAAPAPSAAATTDAPATVAPVPATTAPVTDAPATDAPADSDTTDDGSSPATAIALGVGALAIAAGAVVVFLRRRP